MLRLASAQKAAAQDLTRSNMDIVGESATMAAYKKKSSQSSKSSKGSEAWADSSNGLTITAPSDDRTERRFNIFMSVVILLNVLVMAVEIDATHGEEDNEMRLGWILIDSVFVVIFIVEIAVRACWERRAWVRSGWNWFDAVIVFCAVLDIWVFNLLQANIEEMKVLIIFRIFRMLRLIRLVKLVRVLEGLYITLMAFWRALQSMFFLLCIMLFGILIYGIIATTMIGRNESFRDVTIKGETIDDRFGTVSRSMYSLFELMTLESLEDVARPLVTKQPLTFIFIGSFVMIFTFGLLNMTVALVVEKTMEQMRLAKEHKKNVERQFIVEQLWKFVSAFSGHDNNVRYHRISIEEFDSAVRQSDALRNFFGNMDIKPDQARELFSVIDHGSHGSLTAMEFSEGLRRVQGDYASTWDMLATKATVSQLRGKVVLLDEDLRGKVAHLDEKLEVISSRLEKQDETLQQVLNILKSKAVHEDIL